MKMIMTAFRCLKPYPALSVFAFLSMLGASFFEGISFGMLVPLIQSMINAGQGAGSVLVFIGRLMPAGFVLSQAKAITIVFCGIFAMLCMKNIFLYISSMLIIKLRLISTRDLASSLMGNLIGYDIAYFDRVKIGHLSTNIDAEANRIGVYIMSILNFTSLVIRVVAYAAVLFIISWKASALLFILILIVLLPLEIVMKRLASLGERLSSSLRDFNFKMLEILNGVRLIKERGAEEDERRNFRAAADETYKCHYRLCQHINMLVPVSETVIFGLVTASFAILLNFTNIDITVSFPFVAAYMVILVKMLTQLNQLNSMRSMALSNVAALNNYDSMMDNRGKRTIMSGAQEFRALSKEIVFKDIHFSYEPQKPVLRGLSMVIPQGKMVAIVGSSGAGKTTIVNLIMRFYDPISGEIRVDGIDLRSLDLHSWRRQIGFVSQNLFLFNTSVRDNIAYGVTPTTDEQIIKAAIIAHADEFIQKLPQKYDTIIGERGVQLSGGQRQRLSIARAIIENPQILILDEATSSLDSETEAIINDALETIMAKRTVIAIAHRLATVIRADNIIVLDKGVVASYGTHDELMMTSGLYRKLYETQLGQ